jgi:hypothetical protein
VAFWCKGILKFVSDQIQGGNAVNNTVAIREQGQRDFFISYTSSDAEWAKWIAWELSRAGFTYAMQETDFPPGSRFMNEMQHWLQSVKHILAVVSPAYFQSDFASLEMRSGVVIDPLGYRRFVIPVRITHCELPNLFSDIVFIDFVGKNQDEQRRSLIAGVRASMVGNSSDERIVKTRPEWPGGTISIMNSSNKNEVTDQVLDLPLRIQYFPCDVGRGLDFKTQHQSIQNALEGSRYGAQTTLQAEFDVTDTNLFKKLNQFRPHMVHISGNQNGSDVLFPSHDNGEIVVPAIALAGLLSSLGSQVCLVIIDTCQSYKCALRVCEAVKFAIGVDDDIYDDEATRFYEVLYQALGAGHSIADAHRQAVASLEFTGVPASRIPKLCVKAGQNASSTFLLGG